MDIFKKNIHGMPVIFVREDFLIFFSPSVSFHIL